MKRIATLLFALSVLIATSAFATTIGTVNMQKIFKSSSRVKKINSTLKSKFAKRKNKLVAQGKALQTDIKKYQKNKSVMKKTTLAKLQNKIQKESDDLRQAQTKFQQDLFATQNSAMHTFMKTLSSTVASVAKQDKIDLVLPQNNLIYANNKLDITNDVLKKLG